jgi:V-type H+-transporting ATPase subunit F|tara:strand:+ start:1060 stop:1299 length:240 start_codon:yes stop_codon:yes gene_type:complete
MQQLLERTDVGIILIAQSAAERVRSMIVEHVEDEEKVLPTVMEIPSKDQAYEPTKDSMMIAAASKLYGYEAGMEKLKDI